MACQSTRPLPPNPTPQTGPTIPPAAAWSTKPQNQTAQALLVASIDSSFNDPSFAHAHWGAVIQSLKTGKIWYERNADRMFMPASNEKIITGAVSLLKLGTDFKYQTPLTYRGKIENGVLKGDLIVFGQGDPSLYTRFYSDPREVFQGWAAKLKAMGIKEISGDIIGDDNAFEDYPYGSGWPFDDFEYSYSAEIGALQLNENYVDLKITPPPQAGAAYHIDPSTPSAYYTIENQLQTIEKGNTSVMALRPFGDNKIILKGQMLRGGNPVYEAPTITNGTLFYVTVLKETIEATGIKVSGQAKDCDALPNWNAKPSDFTLIDNHMSPSFAELLNVMMKVSQNLYAETFTRTLGLQAKGLGSFENGKEVVSAQLQAWGIAPSQYVYADGSGLSRYNYTNPRILTTILTRMLETPLAEAWKAAFPIAGEDGTLKNRMKGTAAAKNVLAKTGTIANTRGLSGYVTTADGEPLVFSFMVNGHLLAGRDTDRITDGILVKIARFKGNK